MGTAAYGKKNEKKENKILDTSLLFENYKQFIAWIKKKNARARIRIILQPVIWQETMKVFRVYRPGSMTRANALFNAIK